MNTVHIFRVTQSNTYVICFDNGKIQIKNSKRWFLCSSKSLSSATAETLNPSIFWDNLMILLFYLYASTTLLATFYCLFLVLFNIIYDTIPNMSNADS